MNMRSRFLVITWVIFNLQWTSLPQFNPLGHGKLVSDGFGSHQGISVEKRHQLFGLGSDFTLNCRSYKDFSVINWVQMFPNSKNHNCTVTEDWNDALWPFNSEFELNLWPKFLITRFSLPQKTCSYKYFNHQYAWMLPKITRNKFPMSQRIKLR